MPEPKATNRQDRLLSLVRSYRSELNSENFRARSLVRDELSRELGISTANTDTHTETAVKIETESATEKIAQPENENLTASQLDLKIRKLIQAGAEWITVEPIVWQMVRSNPSAETSIKAFELGALNGGIGQIDRIASLLLGMGLNHFEGVHSGIRSAIVVKLWELRKIGLIRELMSGNSDESQLNDAEMLFRFFELLNSDELLDALALFHHYFDRIETAIHRFGRILSLTRDQLYLKLTRSAIQICQDGLARRFALQIEPTSREYNEAFELLGSIPESSRSDHFGAIDGEIRNKSDWRERIQTIQDRTEEFARNPRASLATDLISVFADPLRYLPQGGEPWRMMARYCLSRFELTWQIPTFLNIFCDNILQFHTRPAELALWDQSFSYHGPNPSLRELCHYLSGVAAMHRFIANGPRAEALLWQAHGMISRSGSTVLISQRPCWSDICSAAANHLKNSKERSVAERDQMLGQIDIASDVDRLSSADILRYLSSELPIADAAIGEIQIIARSRNDVDLEMSVLQRKAQQLWAVNQDLDRLFQIAVARENNDLAWRAATVLKNRRILDPAVQSVWEFSGECRQSYPIVAPDLALLRKCFTDLPTNIRKLANDFVVISGVLPELLMQMDKKLVRNERMTASPNEAEEILERKLMQIEWLPARSRIIYSPELVVLDQLLVIPPFVEVVERTDWNYVFLRICEKTGLCAFGWDGAKLQGAMAKMVDANGEIRIAPEFGPKFERIINQLEIEESIALRGFAACALKMGREELISALAMIVCRVSLVVYPSHDQALSSVMKMRAPINLIRNIEAMMISDAYSSIRRSVGLASNIPASASVRSRASILKLNSD
jgi:hypothetical protein